MQGGAIVCQGIEFGLNHQESGKQVLHDVEDTPSAHELPVCRIFCFFSNFQANPPKRLVGWPIPCSQSQGKGGDWL